MNILKNIGASYLSIAIAGGAVILCVPIFSRNFGADLLAEILFMLMVLGVANIVDFFKYPIIVYFSSDTQGSRGRIRTALLVHVVGVLTALVALILLLVAIALSGRWTYFYSSLLFLPSINIFSSYLEAKGQIAVSSALRAMFVSVVYGGIAYLSQGSADLECYSRLIFFASTSYFGLVMGAVWKLTEIRFSLRVDRKFRRVFLGRAKSYLVFNLATYCVVYLDRIFLSVFGSASQFAVYSAVHEVTSRLLVVYRGATVPLLRDLRVRFLASKKEMINAWGRVSFLSTLMVVLLYFLYLSLFQNFTIYDSGITLFRKDILFYFVFGISIQVFGYLFPLVLNAMGDFITQARVFAFISFLLMLFIYPMYALLGIGGIVILVVVTKVMYFVIFLHVAYRVSRECHESRRLLSYTFANGLVLVALFIGAIYWSLVF